MNHAPPQTFETPFGSFTLGIHRVDRTKSLRAWDAADALVLDHLFQQPADSRLVIVDDTYGALAVATTDRMPVVLVDSWTGREASVRNHELNGLASPSFTDPLSGFGDVANVVIRMPKSLERLRELFDALRLAPGADVSVVGMDRRIPRSAFELMERRFGHVDGGRSVRKARVLRSSVREVGDSGRRWPAVVEHVVAGTSVSPHAHGGVFAGTSIDAATRLLAESMRPMIDELHPEVVVDLGSGSGVLGTLAAMWSGAAAHLVDDSAAAVRSSRATADAAGVGQQVQVHHQSNLDEVVVPGSVDLVVCNPPFHDDRGQNDQVAWEMYHQARRALRRGGRLLVVTNRHLGTHARLAKVFGNATVVAEDRQFVVVQSDRT